jgi:hypothetical protein
MINTKFNRLTVLSFERSDGNYNKYWRCLCDCGKETVVVGDKLRSGRTKSCGCYGDELRNALIKKADEERRLYTKKSYHAMINRCYNPKAPNYSRYGEKGVTVCDRWRFGENGLTGWLCFFEDMGPKPTGHSIDRVDNGKGYFKDNCRWATKQEQSLNRKRTWKWSKNSKLYKVIPADY